MTEDGNIAVKYAKAPSSEASSDPTVLETAETRRARIAKTRGVAQERAEISSGAIEPLRQHLDFECFRNLLPSTVQAAGGALFQRAAPDAGFGRRTRR